VPVIDHDDLRIHYSERGNPDGPPVVLVHGLLFSSRMFHRLAEDLRGHRILLVDVRGHGASSRPTDAAAYSWSSLAGDVRAVLDHLDIERAVVGGLSLGANVTLAFANDTPERTAGMVVEMPVLDEGQPFARKVFTALASTLTVTAPVLGPITSRTGHLPVPRSIPELAAVRDLLGLDPASGAALLHGLLGDHLLLEDLDQDRLKMPALVIGHRGDPLHPLLDAQRLVAHLADARLDVRHTILDYRVLTRRQAGLLERFIRETSR
jgi:pimeloyl-ACP methyl ester carboxylesterase